MVDRPIEAAFRVLAPTSRIARRLLLVAGLIGIVGALAVTALQLAIDYRQQTEIARRNLDLFASVSGPSIGASLWQLESDHLALQLEGLTRLPGVTAVELDAGTGGRYRFGATYLSSRTIAESFPVIHTAGSEQRSLGTLTLMKDMDEDIAGLLDHAASVFFAYLVVACLSAFGIAVAFQMLVTRRLLSVADFMRSITPDDVRRRWNPDELARPSKSRDEIDDLTQSIVVLQHTAFEALSEAELSEQRFRAYAGMAADWYWETDENDCYVAITEGYDAATGRDRRALIGKSRSEYVLVGLPDDVRRAHLAQLAVHAPFREIEMRIESPKGTCWVRAAGVPKFDADGTFRGYRGKATDITEVKRARLDYERLRTRLDEAVNSVSDGMAIFDENDVLIFCNERYRQHHPWIEDADFSRMTYTEMIDRLSYNRAKVEPDEAKRREWRDRRMTYRDRPGTFFTVQTSDGRWIRVADYRTRSGGTVIVRTDISELIAQQDELQRSEERFALAMRGADDGLWDWNLQSGAFYYSPRWFSMLGYGPDELPGTVETWEALVDPLEKARVKAAALKCAAGEAESFEVEFRMRHKDGGWVWVLSRAFLVTDESGAPARVVGTHVDVTARKRAEQELADRNRAVELLGRVAAAANEAADPDHALQTVIDLVCDFLDWPVGHAYLFDPRDNVLTPSPLWHFAEPVRYRAFRRVTNGARFEPGHCLPGRAFERKAPLWVGDITDHNTYVRGAVADAVGLRCGLAFPVTVGDDIVAVLEFFSAERREPEQQVIGILDQVGRQVGRVFERVQANASIVAARDDAERATKAKSEFLANMSHELRTPLNIVVGFAEIIAGAAAREVSPDYRRFAGDILASGHHLLDLINDLLDISKIESGHFELARESYALLPDIEALVELVSAQFARKGLTLNVRVDGVAASAVVNADRRALRQIVLNLLSNAMKFSYQDGAVDLQIAAHGNDLRLAVVDRGIGIAERDLARVFERFEQVRGTRRHAGGTGIGLPLSRTLAQLHGGSLHLESAEGVGTTAILVLPGALRTADGTGPVATAEAGAEPDIVSFDPPPRILVAEDHPVNGALMREILSGFGCRIELAVNGEEAVAAALRTPFDLIFMDIQMPNMNGLDAARAIRDLGGAGACVPIVALSANALPEHREATRSAGMDGHVTKPVTRAVIAAALRRWLSPGGTAEHPDGAAAPVANLPHTGTRPATDGSSADTAIARTPPTGEAASADPIIDRIALGDMIASVGRDTIERLVRHLADDRTARLVEIHTAFEAGDFDTVGASVHRLKGSFANLGARRVAMLASEIERLAEARDRTTLADRLPAFDTASRQSIALLDGVVRQHAGSPPRAASA